MRKIILLLIISVFSLKGFSQDFSNKGRDFWVGYGYHQVMTGGGNLQDMVLYFATDQVSNVTVSIPLLGYSVTYNNIAANTVFQTPALPKAGGSDARLFSEGLSNKGIHITSDVPIVAYAHIYNASVSGATVLYPVNTLGKDYYSVNFTNNSNIANANCWFYVVAVDTGTTSVSITPSANTIGGWTAGSKNTVTLTQGQVYNVMGVTSGNNGVDLTGSIISSIASGSGGCKRIAVFSGSGRIAISCNGSAPSSDNYMVQGLPKSAWGKRFLTTPSASYASNSGVAPPMQNIYRVCVADPTTVVTLNGLPIPYPLIGGFYYEIPSNANLQKIVADKPIMVAQYLPSQGNTGCGTGTGDGDPEVIYLSPIEQSINTVRWDACHNSAINQFKHYINVVIPNSGTAISSVLLDGATLPAGTFTVDPQDPLYSYAIIRVSGSPSANVAHVIQSDSGFNAIAYGYGGTESYGYNAGTNVIDLYQHVGIFTPDGNDPNPVICTGTDFKFKVSLPYIVDSIIWNLSGLPASTTPNNTTITTRYECPPVTYPCWDSSTNVNLVPIFWYSLPSNYNVPVTGSYNLSLTTFFPNGECGNSQDIPFTLQVINPPTPSFTYTPPGCYLESTQFNETTSQVPKPTYKWNWDFGDPLSGPTNNVSILKNPTHIFSGPGTYTVKFWDVTTPGCVSNTVTQQVIIADVPNATINGTTTVCLNSTPLPSVTLTGTGGVAPYTFYYSINGIVQTPVNSNAAGLYTINNIPTNVAGPFIYSIDSIKNVGSTLCKRPITGQTATVNVSDNATIALSSLPPTINQTVCVNALIDQIDYLIGNGTGGSFTPAVAGLSGSYNAGTKIYSITGAPTTAGTYTLTIKPTGPCVDPTVSLTATIIVNANATLSLSSGSANQTRCINTPIIDVVYDVGGGATNATVLFTPALPGVTGSYNGVTKRFTITGTPTATVYPYTYAYSVSTISTCINPPPATGTITVNPDATIGLTSAASTTIQTLCNNNAIVDITYQVGGSVTSVNVAPLPAGITFLYTPGINGNPGTLKISGTATAATTGPLIYTVSLTGPCQTIPPTPMTGSINVTPNASISLSATSPGQPTQTVCVNNPILLIRYDIVGAVTAVNVTGLPSGVTSTYTPGSPSGILTIQGTPTAAVASPYTITITGPCQVPLPSGGTITATAGATISLLVPGSNTQAVCVNKPISTITYTLGGSATGVTLVSGSFPPGVNMATVGSSVVINGSPTVVSTTPMLYNYTLNTVGPCPSVGPVSGSITVNPDHTLTLNAGSENQTLCSGTQIAQIMYTFDGGATGVTVTGLPAAGLNYTVAGNVVTIQGSATGSVTYIITTTGNTCQTASRGGTINAVPLPTGNFSFNTPSCNTRTISFTDNSVPNAGAITTWAWNFGDIASGPNNTSSQTNPTHIFSLPGTYTVGLTVTTSPNGCSNATPFTRLVTINERPKTDFTVPTSACVSDIAQFIDASTQPINNGTFDLAKYEWNFGDPTSPTNIQFSKNGTHQFTAGGTYTVTHISVSSAGCADTITHTVNISSAPVSNFSVTNSGALCVNDSVAIVNLSSIGVGSITKLEIYWDYLNAPGTFVVDNAPLINTVYKHKYPNFQVPGSKPYTVMVRSFSGVSCTNDKQTVITVNAVPKVQFNTMPDVCYDAAPFQITQASEIGGVAGNGVYTGPGVNATGLFNPVTAGIGTHIIKYTFTSVAGCVDTMSNTIKVLDTASANFSYVNPICEGSPVTFKEESTAPAGVVLNNTLWNFGDGSPAESHAPGTTFTHNFAPGWGSYNVTMYNTSSFGCKSTTNTQQVYVNPNPKPDFAFVSTAAVCLPNAAVSFLNNSSIADNSAITYAWDFGDSKTSSAKVPPPHVYTGTGPYTVTLTVTSAAPGGGCIKTVNHLVDFIHPQPKAAFDFSKPEVCIGGGVIVTDKTNGLDGTVQQWFWDFDDNIKGNTRQVQHLYTASKTYNVSLYIINSQGCNSDTLTQQFTVHPYPIVDAGPDGIVLEGGSYRLQPIVTNSADYQYLWTPATYLNSTTAANPTANIILDDITYTLVVTGRGGCVAPPDKVFIKVLKAPRIPNTFTPNGDGINELWLIDYLDTYPNCRVQVFTRTGQLVFQSTGGYKKPWDGKVGGKPLPFDTYYYIIEPGNGRAPITGYVTIVK
jgi:gliding motility-associated-like protein